MTQLLDTLIVEQENKRKRLNERTFWNRNKHMLIIIGFILMVLLIFSMRYVSYWLPRVYDASSSMK